MSGFFQDLLRGTAEGTFGSATLRDYAHASKIFTTNSYANSPKHKFLFHTVFTLNDGVFAGDQTNFGILVRDVKLPSFSVENFKLNQYNRKRVVQTKIRYDPVTINFFDDNANTINKLWYAYYTYYYKDATKPSVFFKGNRGGQTDQPGSTDSTATQPTLANYDYRNIYDASISGNDDWGYIGETSAPSNPSGTKLPFFKDIRIFGFWQHNWTAYVLVNPIITSFNHDTFNYDDGNGVMKNTMTLEYETVVYHEGNLDGNKPENIVTGFGDIASYDRRPSPIMAPGSNSDALGQGGLVNSVGGAVKGMATATSASGFFGSALQLGQVFYNNKNVNLVQSAKVELQNALVSALNNPNVTRNVIAQYPNTGASPSNIAVAGAPPAGTTSSPKQIGPTTAGVQVTGTALSPKVFVPNPNILDGGAI